MSDMKANPFQDGEDKYDPEIPTLTLEIYKGLKKEHEDRDDSPYIDRASSSTNCPKRRWFHRKGFKGETLTPRKNINFMLGDLSEKTMVHFVSKYLVGKDKPYSEVVFGEELGKFAFNGKEIKIFDQLSWTTIIRDDEGRPKEISGHPDGIAKRSSDGKWELLEFKSAANWGYKSFKENGPGDYLKQAHCLMMSNEAKKLGIQEVRFFYMKKETGHIWDKLIPYDTYFEAMVESEFRVVWQLEEPGTYYQPVPEMKSMGRGKPKKKTGRTMLQFPCTYCPYKEKCHGKIGKPDMKKDQWGSLKPTWIVNPGNLPFQSGDADLDRMLSTKINKGE